MACRSAQHVHPEDMPRNISEPLLHLYSPWVWEGEKNRPYLPSLLESRNDPLCGSMTEDDIDLCYGKSIYVIFCGLKTGLKHIPLAAFRTLHSSTKK